MKVPVLFSFGKSKSIEEIVSEYFENVKFYVNPYLLQIGTTNDFGIVDVSGKIGTLKNITGVNHFIQEEAAKKPLLETDTFGSGFNSVYFSGIIPHLTMFNSNNFKPEWNQKTHIATKVKYRLDGDNYRQVIYYRSELIADRRAMMLSIRDDVAQRNKLEVVMWAYNSTLDVWKYKQVLFDNALTDGNVYDIIFDNPGTDDANDWKIQINYEVSPKTIVRNDSFVGCVSYPNQLQSAARLGWNEANGNYFKGNLGKFIEGFGGSNKKAVKAILNSNL